MTNVTCRPMPEGCEGIGTWQVIFENISLAAIAINVGVAVFNMDPFRQLPMARKLIAFLVLEHAMLFLRGVVAMAIPDQPEDVQRIEDFNTRFKAKFRNQDSMLVSPRNSLRNLDISLGPSHIDVKLINDIGLTWL